jgi:hypothetical protein
MSISLGSRAELFWSFLGGGYFAAHNTRFGVDVVHMVFMLAIISSFSRPGWDICHGGGSSKSAT